MKKPIYTICSMILLFFCSLHTNAQESLDQDTETITGVFDTFDGENFIFNITDENNEEDIMLFSKANDGVLTKYNLSDEKYSGKTFSITFISETETEVDEDGDEQAYTVRTITDLELLD
ncbi:hypothetical protein [Aquimarina sp. SS2-1]|uniref:hypothetical protein n=1 Tax=Aquimarina besae TaxID=3342247 RepID=UPI00366CD4AD